MCPCAVGSRRRITGIPVGHVSCYGWTHGGRRRHDVGRVEVESARNQGHLFCWRRCRQLNTGQTDDCLCVGFVPCSGPRPRAQRFQCVLPPAPIPLSNGLQCHLEAPSSIYIFSGSCGVHLQPEGSCDRAELQNCHKDTFAVATNTRNLVGGFNLLCSAGVVEVR
jgi:hypothetical protein